MSPQNIGRARAAIRFLCRRLDIVVMAFSSRFHGRVAGGQRRADERRRQFVACRAATANRSNAAGGTRPRNCRSGRTNRQKHRPRDGTVRPAGTGPPPPAPKSRGLESPTRRRRPTAAPEGVPFTASPAAARRDRAREVRDRAEAARTTRPADQRPRNGSQASAGPIVASVPKKRGCA